MEVYMEKERLDYLKGLSDDYGVPFKTVKLLASLLGESEDHDGLISELEDMEDICEEE
jgi:hypothetical protein